MIDINPSPNITIIVACAENYAIGKDNDLMWHLSDDLKRFKQLTMGHAVIMGRKTWESLPKKPLPGRKNIVLTHDTNFEHPEEVVVCHSVQSILKELDPDDETFIMGGASLYQAFLPFVHRIQMTWIHQDFDGDVYFPPIDKSVFRLISQTERMQDEKSGLCYSYADYERILGK